MADFIAQSIDGVLHVSPKKEFRHEVEKFQGKRFTIRILKRARSTQSNRYYWACLGHCSDATGYTPDEWHDAFKRRFLEKDLKVVIGGEEVDSLGSNRSTASLNQEDFSEYINKIRDYASQVLKIYIPTSEEYLEEILK